MIPRTPRVWIAFLILVTFTNNLRSQENYIDPPFASADSQQYHYKQLIKRFSQRNPNLKLTPEGPHDVSVAKDSSSVSELHPNLKTNAYQASHPFDLKSYPSPTTREATLGDSAIIDWTTLYGSTHLPSNDIVTSMTVDNAGNIYVTGQTDSTLSYIDFMTIKYDRNGNLLWSRRYTSAVANLDVPLAIAADSLGNVYVSGTTFNKTSFYDIVTIKYDGNGNELWVRQVNGPGNYYDFGNTIAADSIGNVYVGGFSFSLTSGDYLTLKYTPTGTLEWERRYYGTGSEFSGINAMIIDHAGDIIVTGITNDVLTEGDILTIKYSADGTELWAELVDGPYHGRDNALAIAVDDENNVGLTGYSTHPSVVNEDILTVKYSSDGIFQWWAFYDTVGQYDIGYAIAMDDSGNVYVGGTSVIGAADMFMLKYNSIGIEQWHRRVNNPGSNSSISELHLDSSGNILSIGSTGSIRIFKYSPNGSLLWDVWYTPAYPSAIKLDYTGDIVIAGTSYGTNTENDFLVAKYTPGGNIKWSKTFNGVGYGFALTDAMKVDHNGDIVFAVTNSYLTPAGDRIAAGRITKYSSSGSLLWSLFYPGVYFQDMVLDSANSIYIVANTEGYTTFLVSKYNPSGSIVWVRTFIPISGSYKSKSIGLDSQANVYVGGEYSSNTYDAFFMAKYSHDGDFLWTSSHSFFMGGAVEQATSMSVHPNGTTAVTGYTGTGSITAVFNNTGTLRWAHVGIDGITAWAAFIDDDENVYIGGQGGVAKYHPNGSRIFNKPLTFAFDVTADAGGNTYAVGYDPEIIKFNQAGVEQWRLNVPSSFFHVRLDACGVLYTAGILANNYISVYKINPNSTINWSIPSIQPLVGGAQRPFIELNEIGQVFVGGSTNIGGGGFSAEYLMKMHQSTTFSVSTDTVMVNSVALSCTGQDTIALTTSVCTSSEVFSVSGADSLFEITALNPSAPPSTVNKFLVQFTPSSPGPRSGEFAITHSLTGESLPLQIQGNGTEAYTEFAPGLGLFDSTEVGCQTEIPITIINHRCDTVHLHSLISELDFIIDIPEPVIPPRGSVQVLVRFSPLSVGSKSTELIVTMNESMMADTLLLQGVATGTGSEVAFTDSFQIGWQLISTPVSGICPVLFPGAYSFDGGYRKHDTLAIGSGYWFKIDQPEQSFAGEPVTVLNHPVSSKWNIVGSISGDIPVSSLTTTPPGILQTPFYAYTTSGYVETDTIKPGHGYWVKTTQAGQLFYSTTPPMAPEAVNLQNEPATDRITLTDAQGRSQTLLLARGMPVEQSCGYDLPPPPPEGGFDIRFSSGRRLESVNQLSSGDISILTSGVEYPITIHAEITSGVNLKMETGDQEIELKNGADHTVLAGTGELRLMSTTPESLPQTYFLSQNYPNPFNPSTTIIYGLPSGGHVRIQVFDILGREIETLVNEEQTAGIQSILFKGTDLPSGVYFYRMIAGTFTDLKKFLLLK